MKTHCLPLAAALMFALSPLAASAQASAPAASDAASAGPRAKPAPRQMTPTELRESAAPPGELRPEKPVVPQVSIPFGKTPPGSAKPSVKSESRALRSGKAASGGVDDAAARCEAEADQKVRAACRAKRARELGSTPR
jgi:hypothetical protein